LRIGAAPGAICHAFPEEADFRATAGTAAQVRNCKTASISLREACEMRGDRAANFVVNVCSRSRSALSRAMGWNPGCSELIEEILHGS
jgi:hypothetical protein